MSSRIDSPTSIFCLCSSDRIRLNVTICELGLLSKPEVVVVATWRRWSILTLPIDIPISVTYWCLMYSVALSLTVLKLLSFSFGVHILAGISLFGRFFVILNLIIYWSDSLIILIAYTVHLAEMQFELQRIDADRL